MEVALFFLQHFPLRQRLPPFPLLPEAVGQGSGGQRFPSFPSAWPPPIKASFSPTFPDLVPPCSHRLDFPLLFSPNASLCRLSLIFRSLGNPGGFPFLKRVVHLPAPFKRSDRFFLWPTLFGLFQDALYICLHTPLFFFFNIAKPRTEAFLFAESLPLKFRFFFFW